MPKWELTASLRRGEPYGLKHQLIYDDEPTIEFYGPAAERERLQDAHLLDRYPISSFLRPCDEWQNPELVGCCGVSPDNSCKIAAWRTRNLSGRGRRHHPVLSHRHEASDRAARGGKPPRYSYVLGLFGCDKNEAEWVRVDRRPHAQYADAIFVEFLLRRARITRQLILTSRPRMLIILGWVIQIYKTQASGCGTSRTARKSA